MVLLMPFTWTCTPPFVERHCMCKSLVEIAPSQNDMLCCVKGVKIQHQAVPYVMPDTSLQKQWGVSMATCKLAMHSLPTFNPKLLPCCHILPSDLVRLYQLHCQVFSPEELCGHLASRWRFEKHRSCWEMYRKPRPRPRLQKEGKLPWVVTLDEGNCADFNIFSGS